MATTEPTEAEIVHGMGVLAFTEEPGPRQDYLAAIHLLALEALRNRVPAPLPSPAEAEPEKLDSTQMEILKALVPMGGERLAFLEAEREKQTDYQFRMSVRAGRTEAADQTSLTFLKRAQAAEAALSTLRGQIETVRQFLDKHDIDGNVALSGLWVITQLKEILATFPAEKGRS